MGFATIIKVSKYLGGTRMCWMEQPVRAEMVGVARGTRGKRAAHTFPTRPRIVTALARTVQCVTYPGQEGFSG